MSNFRKDLEEAAGGAILLAVIGEMGWGDYNDPGTVPDEVRGMLLTWEMAAPFLDYEYDSSYGAPECHAVYAYTADRVLFVVQYDGSTRIHAIPRNPVPCLPEMPGG